ncbi:MAG: acyltransferase family protein [Ruminococcus sp.]|nr:acyltransferase family protein [Ruminococcus sp.]
MNSSGLADSPVEKSKRFDEIDIAKGIGIILVILGHCVPYGGFAFNLLFAFHMPLFFMLSGYLFKAGGMKDMTKRKAKRLLIPFVEYMLLGLIVTLIIPEWRTGLSIKGIAGDIYLMSPDNCNNSSIWFLSCLFIVTLAFNLIVQCTENKKHKQVIRIFTVVLLGVIGYLLSITSVLSYFPADRLPFTIDTAFIAITFFTIGYAWRQSNVGFTFSNKKILTTVIIAVALLIVCVQLNGKVNIHSLTFKNPVVYYIGALSGSAAIIGIACLISHCNMKRVGDVLRFYGINSLTVLGIQSILIRLFIYIINMICGTEFELYHQPIFNGVVCFIFVTLISGIICKIKLFCSKSRIKQVNK